MSHKNPPPPQVKYIWNEERDALLKELYVNARNRTAISKGISRIAASLGFPKDAIRQRAICLGLSKSSRPWDESELRYVRDYAGEMSAKKMATMLGRSDRAVTEKLSKLGLSYRIADGYTNLDLAQVLHVSQSTVTRWNREGWLKRSGSSGKYSDTQVKRFLGEHPDQYDLRRVDQEWFKSLMFSSAKCYWAHTDRDNIADEATA